MLETDKNWMIEETEYHPSKEPLGGTHFCTGNGFMGLRGSFEESGASQAQALLVAGLYQKNVGRGYSFADTFFRKRFVLDEVKIRREEVCHTLVNISDPLLVNIIIGGKPFRMWDGILLEYRRWLDMHSSCLCREVRWDNGAGLITRIRIDRFTSMADRNLILMRYAITPENYSGEVCIESGIDASINDRCRESLIDADGAPDGVTLMFSLPDPLMEMGQAVRHKLFLGEQLVEPQWERLEVNRCYTVATQVQVGQGETCCMEKVISVQVSREGAPVDNPIRCAQEGANTALRLGYAQCFEAHRAVWEQIWAQSDIEIEGDDKAQRLVRFAVYHLIIAAPWNDATVSIGARSLSGPGYGGLVFWETDIYLMPFYDWTFPEIARNHFLYRYALLDAARENARVSGAPGARYPWESALSGKEETAEYLICSRTQLHIVPDVCLAAKRYADASGDSSFGARQALEMAIEGARFMAHFTEFDAQKKRCTIRNVGGPDEYHPVTDSNSYTNFMTARLFEYAAGAWAELLKVSPDEASALRERLGLEDKEISAWLEMAQAMEFLEEPGTGLIEQCAGYFQLKGEWSNVGRQYGGPAAEYHECQGIKQPDVLLLLALFPESFSHKHLLANWDYYERFTQHGSSLSPSVHAWMAARIGLMQKARDYFLMGGDFPFTDYNKDSVGGVQIGNSGGLWQAILFGFAGIMPNGSSLRLDPKLPKEWKRLRIRLAYRGQRFRIDIGPEYLQVEADASNSEAIPFEFRGAICEVGPGNGAVRMR